ncbi:hypothetical protein [aff. Roholtiella sp. LEGE 12411]|uniref:hypothetical protein n=1 Tax=aff. Roholtiella sp. LEGE 12411 TaxID=1828822 RepID=UPI001ABD349F|nr:hypothetical protein [aff. Roholtiella sp. LEGE 12411]
MQRKDMMTEQLQNLIRNIVDEYFSDPDEGNKVKESFKQSLLEIRHNRLEGRHYSTIRGV